MARFALVPLFLAIAAPAAADIRVDFREGAPKDRFTLTNVGTCDLTDFDVTIDLTGSQGKLIFDITGAGAGVEVFQPFEIVAGADFLATLPEVVDGQTKVTLEIDTLAVGGQITATTDLDDTIGAREITVRGAEFDGTRVAVNSDAGSSEAVFDGAVSLVAKTEGCTPPA